LWGGGIQPKTVRLIGGIGTKNEFGKQFRQQHRVYDRKQLQPSQSATSVDGLYTRRMDMRNKFKGILKMDDKTRQQIHDENFDQEVEIAIKEDKQPTVEDYLITAKDGEQYGIFKLSPRECLRLMNVRDTDIDKMQAVNSNTQCYKQAGNSIVVSVLVGIFSQLGIQNCKKWNDMTDEERYEIVKPGG
jgi:site-specific DNA-cytosine methylase